MANGSLGDVVRRLGTLDVEEGPEGIGAREELRAVERRCADTHERCRRLGLRS